MLGKNSSRKLLSKIIPKSSGSNLFLIKLILQGNTRIIDYVVARKPFMVLTIQNQFPYQVTALVPLNYL